MTVKNFMVHRSTAVQLYPVTVFVGPNGGGKSALFEALVNFSMVSRGRLSQAFGPGPHSFVARRFRGAGKSARIAYEVELGYNADSVERLKYEISYAQQSRSSDAPSYAIYEERLVDLESGKELFDRDGDICEIKGVAAFLQDETSVFAAVRRAFASGGYKETNALVTHCAREISRISKFRLDPTILARPCPVPETVGDGADSRVRLDYHGEGLAGVLYYLSETGSDEIAALLERLSDVIDGIDGFEFNTVGTERIGFSVRYSDSREVVPAVNLSDGTLSLIGHMVLLHSPERPPIMCLEEPENGLTPRALQAIYESVVAASADRTSQILMSSHSPYVICEAWNGGERDFIYQVKASDGKATVTPFADVIKKQGLQLSKVDGKREKLNLNVANEVMHGYLS